MHEAQRCNSRAVIECQADPRRHRQAPSSRPIPRRASVVATFAVVAALVIGGACGAGGSSPTNRAASTADRVACEAWAKAEGAASAATASMTTTLRLSNATARRVLRLANEAIAKMRAAHDRRIVHAAPVLEIVRHNMTATLRGTSSTSGEPRDLTPRIHAVSAACATVTPSTATPTKSAQ